MSFTEFLQKHIRPLSLTENLSHAIDVMESQNITHLPVIDNNIFLGSLSVEDIYGLDNNTLIENVGYLWQPFFVRENPSWLELYEVFSKNKSTIVPVLNKNNTYIGYYILDDVSDYFMNMPLFKEQGVILDIEHSIHKYSMNQVSQIVESNNGKLLGAFISEMVDDTIRISIKFTSTNINDTIQTFRRYEYRIITNHSEDRLAEQLEDRSNYLDKYINL